jgi:NADH-ubiquinone oxidoreductase chain 1
MILMCTLTSILFLGGYLLPFSLPFSNNFINFLQSTSLGIKTSFFLFGFIWTRATYPRVKFNQLISLCWKSLLPIVLGLFVFIFSLLIIF